MRRARESKRPQIKSKSALKEPLTDRIGKVKTPEWVLKVCPNTPAELPEEFVGRLNRGLEEGKKTGRKNPPEFAIFLYSMNNFIIKNAEFEMFIQAYGEKWIREKLEPGKKDDVSGMPASNLKKSQSYSEFHSTVAKVISECGLSLERAGEIDKEEGRVRAHRYLFPAFLKLLDMGYKSYPDLSV